MFSRTRAQRQKANTAKQMARLFPVDPILVLERLDAAATAQLAALRGRPRYYKRRH